MHHQWQLTQLHVTNFLIHDERSDHCLEFLFSYCRDQALPLDFNTSSLPQLVCVPAKLDTLTEEHNR